MTVEITILIRYICESKYFTLQRFFGELISMSLLSEMKKSCPDQQRRLELFYFGELG